MRVWLLITFIVIPIIEISVFVAVSEATGTWVMLVGIVLSAIIGATVVQYQGISTLKRAHKVLQRNVPPVKELFEGIFFIFAGILLLTPGFLTDAIGMFLLLKFFRNILSRLLVKRLIAVFQSQPPSNTGENKPTIIDGDFEEIQPHSQRQQIKDSKHN